MNKFWQDVSDDVFQITHRIYLGGYLSSAKVDALLQRQINHVVNVGTMPNQYGQDKFKITYMPIEDLKLLPLSYVKNFLRTFHHIHNSPDSKIYIHCLAGQNRSPTLLWLYFISCGMPEESARMAIEKNTLETVPGHSNLVNDELLNQIRDFASVQEWQKQIRLFNYGSR